MADDDRIKIKRKTKEYVVKAEGRRGSVRSAKISYMHLSHTDCNFQQVLQESSCAAEHTLSRMAFAP